MAHLTILSGPAGSGKTTYVNSLLDDPKHPMFVWLEGNGRNHKLVMEVLSKLALGRDVIYETMDPIHLIPSSIMNRVDTIEIFRIDVK